MIATVANGYTPLTTNSQSVIINIPITIKVSAILNIG